MNKMAISNQFSKLTTALRIVTSKHGDTFDLDKERTSEDDVLDSFIPAIYPIQLNFKAE